MTKKRFQAMSNRNVLLSPTHGHINRRLTNFLMLGQSVENATCHQVVGSADINGKVAKNCSSEKILLNNYK
jgi:hypothetical protein